jgi:hypothetical protein
MGLEVHCNGWLLSSLLVESHDRSVVEEVVPKSLERVYNSRNCRHGPGPYFQKLLFNQLAAYCCRVGNCVEVRC